MNTTRSAHTDRPDIGPPAPQTSTGYEPNLVIWNASSPHIEERSELRKESAYGESRCERPADRAVDFELRRNGRIWRGKFVVTVLPGRYLSDAASFCDVRTAWRARMLLPNSASTNTQLASGVADF